MTHLVVSSPVTQPLAGKYGLVTGGSKGIGRAIAIRLAEAGAKVGVCYSTDRDAALNVVDAMNGSGVAIPVQVQSVWEATLQRMDLGPFDFLVNNAGISEGRSVRNMTDGAWQNVIDVNLTGTMKMTRAVLPGMIEKGYGRIVNITSVVGIDGRLGPSSYAASKAGIIGFTKACAHEVAGKGITVNAIAPGFIDDTGLLAQVPENLRNEVVGKIPMGRFGRPEDVAEAALYLIAHGDYVTGTVLNVSGGYST